MDYLTRVRQIAADTFGIPLETISLQSSSDNIEAWDSLGHLNFILALERELGVRFTNLAEVLSIEAIISRIE